MGNYNERMHSKRGSSGIAKAGLITGIIGTTAALSGSNCNRNCNNNGLLGNLFGGNNCNCDYVDEKEFAWAQAFNASEAKLARCESERYADSVGLNLYEQLVSERKEIDQAQNDGFRFLFEEIRKQDKELAITQSDLRCLTAVNEKEHEALENGYKCAVSLEAERRRCADEVLAVDVESNYVRAKKVIPASDICPQVQLKCPDVQLVEIVSSCAQAFASAMGVNSAKAVVK